MVNQNKILTVSYGTFSCTLEGFDDPFSTMKAIAEYFRDLAAEDRYFGAEPPQPDAGMLKLIAEREMQRRIDAKIGDNSVILRASEPVAPEAVPESLPQASEQAAPEAPDSPVVLVEPAEDAARQLPEPALAPEVSENVAAKLARIRNAVARARQDALLSETAPEAVPEAADVETPAPPAAEAPAAPQAPFAGLAVDTPDFDAAGFDGFPDEFAGGPGSAPAEDWFEDTQLAGAADADLDLGAVLAARQQASEIKAEEEKAEEDPESGETSADEGFDDKFSAEGSFDSEAELEDLHDLPRQAGASPAEVDAPEGSADPEQDDDLFDDAFDMAALSASLNAPEAPAAEAAPDSAAEIAAEAPLDEAPESIDSPEVPEPLEPLEAPEAVQSGQDAPRTAEPDVSSAADPLSSGSENPETPVPRRQRIIRIRRGQRSEAAGAAAPVSLLSPEAEEELARELALMAQDPGLGFEDAAAGQATENAQDDEALRSVIESLSLELDQDDEAEPLVASRQAPIADAAPEPTEPTEPTEADLSAPGLSDIERALAEPVAAQAESPAFDDTAPEIAVADEYTEADLADDSPETGAEPRAQAEDPALEADVRAAVGKDSVAPSQPPEMRGKGVVPSRPSRPVRPSRPDGQRPNRTERPLPVIANSRPRRGALERGPDDSAEADRLLRQTNDAMQGSESRRRVATIAHLKAAVAATVAERLTRREGEAPTESDPSEAFRADLAQAVRPRRPVAVPGAGAVAPTRPVAPGRDRIPPLVLISEQRVPKSAPVNYDEDDDGDDDDALDAPNIFAASGEFTDFGHRMGARTAAEWMEAAAAHLMIKDGLDQFTRPQLVGRLLSHPPIAEKLDREAQLALFGTLLREGRLLKPRRGLFSLSDSSSLLAQARRLAG
jgi:hypothetical protein